MNFHDMGLKPEILQAIETLGYVQPTPIQEKAMPHLLDGRTDVVGLAQTGTGKTAAFGLPLLHLIDFDSSDTQGLVLCPTRELCLQIADDFSRYARHIKGARIAAVYGGASIREQMAQLKKGAQVVVATPGRLLDLFNRKAVRLEEIAYAVLDEADEMLNMGFQEDIEEIMRQTPVQKRIWFFSATMPTLAQKIAETYLKKPVEIAVGVRNTTAVNIAHTCYVIREKDRYPALRRLIDATPDIFGLIFCRTREETRSVAEKLVKDGYDAEAIHGELAQVQRTHIMKKFKAKSLQLLVATDVAARGLDVNDITHVIHYNLPDEPERYTHRSGRTARAGKSGAAMILVNTKETGKIRAIEKMAGIRFTMGRIPEARSIYEKQLQDMVDTLTGTSACLEEIDPFLPSVYEALASFSKEELIKRFAAVKLTRFISDYQGAEDIQSPVKKSLPPSSRPARSHRARHRRLFINLGRANDLRQGAIVRLVCDRAGIPSHKIGGIDLENDCSFFEIEESVADHVIKSLKGATLDGRKIRTGLADTAKYAVNHEKSKRKSQKRLFKRVDGLRLP